MQNKDEKIGYRRPPVRTRFKPGVSGNPKGRPKNALSLQKCLREELSEFVPDGVHSITKLRAIIKAMVAEAANGDLRAANTVLTLYSRMCASESPSTEDLDDEDRAIAEASRERLRDAQRSPQTMENTTKKGAPT